MNNMKKIVVATKNQGKLKELRALMAHMPVEVVSMQEVCPNLEIEETGKTFMDNARLKARAVFEQTGLTCIADDSGLEVAALNGRPGVYSARYCGEDAGYDVKISSLLKELQDKTDRSARYVCAICCLAAPDGTEIQAFGIMNGEIGTECRGENGFGYDPVFYVEGRSVAEMTNEEKNAISHRGKAMHEFIQKIEIFCGENLE